MYLSRSQSRSWQYLTICIFRTIIRAAMIPLEGEGFGPDLIKDYFKGKPKWSGQGRRLNTRVQAISGKPERNSKFLFIVNILGYLKILWVWFGHHSAIYFPCAGVCLGTPCQHNFNPIGGKLKNGTETIYILTVFLRYHKVGWLCHTSLFQLCALINHKRCGIETWLRL